MYRCPICGELFASSENLQRHDHEKHNGVVYSEKFIEDFRFVNIVNDIQQNIKYNFT